MLLTDVKDEDAARNETNIEDIVGELSWIPEWEELPVNLLELWPSASLQDYHHRSHVLTLLVELSGRTILEKTLVLSPSVSYSRLSSQSPLQAACTHPLL